MSNSVVIVGAGPAGLTAAIELQRLGFRDITIVESSDQVGGISKTVYHNGNRIDIGGHRFFSKSDWVMNWWSSILPIASLSGDEINLKYKGKELSWLSMEPVADSNQKNVMLIRSRLSRIYFNRNFIDYPLKINLKTLRKLGLFNSFKFGVSYFYSKCNPIKNEVNLEDFLINRFGYKLYQMFFKEYTEKVWGVSCSKISAAWGAQRIKSLSISKAIVHYLRNLVSKRNSTVAQQTSLIEKFLYPKYGPGQMWEVAAEKFVANGGKLILNAEVDNLIYAGTKVTAVKYLTQTAHECLPCSHLISTMPIKHLVMASEAGPFSNEAKMIASNLEYRDFITVGLLYNNEDLVQKLSDNWIYIQESGVHVGRVQIFNNWSPSMVADPDKVWIGLEFFCTTKDELWNLSEESIIELAQKEINQIGLIASVRAIDSIVVKVEKAYPGYFGDAYSRFELLKKELDEIENLFLIGRNGMHRYNNQDHSMLTAKEAANQIYTNKIDKDKIWSINVDDEYHESK